MIETCVMRLVPILVLAIAGNGYDERCLARWLFSQASGYLISVDARQADIEQHDFRLEFERNLNRPLAVVHHFDVMAEET